jgi:ribonuclease P protein component
LPSHEFPVTKRLIHASEFDAVFGHPDFRVSLPSFLFLVKHNVSGFNRLGMVISKKNVPTAVARNNVKRNIRECFRQQPLLGKHGLDIVVLARRGAATDPALSDTMIQCFKKINRKATAPETC